MCFATRMRIIRRIFNSPCLYVAVFLFIISVYMILKVTRDNKYTPINEKNDENNNKWKFTLNYKKGETVPTKSFEDLNTFPIYMASANTLLIILIIIFLLIPLISIILLLCFCYLCRICRKYVYPTFHDIENPDIEDIDFARLNMSVPVRFQNSRVVLGLGNEFSSDDEV